VRLVAKLVVFTHSVVVFNNGSTGIYVGQTWPAIDDSESAN
jgi:hypothetical protein